ncbi:hypothetical protein [Pseudoruegeria sp. HB172150]|uniref:hypothetical protein n=1 Tax=Pseudoruegeria sp. HB172150 TaxID=2721164 RepID=UPI0015576076|nr:hypothetical protein [Pseudoruegeria sp. HB172150]
MRRIWNGIAGLRHRVAGSVPGSTVVVSFNHDGMEVARVRSNRRWMPTWHLIFFVYLAVIIRIAVVAQIGPGGYNARLSQMQEGNILEQATAFVMQLDPVTKAIAGEVRDGMNYLDKQVFGREVWNG